jgi:serine phosphatase RsbU (regulator of sigma subunit)
MINNINNYVSNIGIYKDASASGTLKVKTFNWILFWTFWASLLWSAMLFGLGQPYAALFPLLATISIPISFYILAKKQKFHQALNVYIITLLVLPPFVQLFHGGIINSGAVVVWTILAPITAMIFKKIKIAKLIFGFFLLALILGTVTELLVDVPFKIMSQTQIVTQFMMNIVGLLTIIYFPILHFTNEMLEQRKTIKSQNDKIVSSINYAKYIQTASLLANDELSASLNNDFFLYYKPKDIVSGDFYWVNNKNGRLIIICADCTGHGVPGAFMTMMGINHLNNIINEKGITDPSMILLFLHYAVRDTLKYSAEKINDGMDISICSIDMNIMKMEYSGARNKMYYFNEELHTYPGTKTSIGDNQENVMFEKFSIDMKPGDCFYLFSDGYIDQFGGPKEKRFGSKQLSNLINEIKPLDIKEQGQIIASKMDNWKTGVDQIDDITFMGFKV